MFKKQTLLFILPLFLLSLCCYWFLCSPSQYTRRTYLKLMANYESNKMDRVEKVMGPLEQIRSQVSKQILYTKNSDRMESRLTGDSSHLIFTKQTGELIEELKGVTCTIQDKLDSEQPQKTSGYSARTFKAKDAIYSYQTGQLEANDVEVAHYLIPEVNHLYSFDLSDPIFEGKAQTLNLTLLKQPQVNAQGFQGIFHSWGFE